MKHLKVFIALSGSVEKEGVIDKAKRKLQGQSVGKWKTKAGAESYFLKGIRPFCFS